MSFLNLNKDRDSSPRPGASILDDLAIGLNTIEDEPDLLSSEDPRPGPDMLAGLDEDKTAEGDAISYSRELQPGERVNPAFQYDDTPQHQWLKDKGYPTDFAPLLEQTVGIAGQKRLIPNQNELEALFEYNASQLKEGDPLKARYDKAKAIEETYYKKIAEYMEGEKVKYPGVWGEFVKSFKQMAIQVPAGIAGTLREAAPRGAIWDDQFENMSESLWEYSQSKAFEAYQGEEDKKKAFVAQSIGGAAPYMIASTLGHMAVGPAGSFMVGFSVEGEEAYRTALRNGMTKEEAQLHRFFVGTINGAIESLQASRIIKFATGGRVNIKQFARNIAAKAWKEVAKDVGRFTLRTANHALQEALEEGLQEGNTMLWDKESGWEGAPGRIGKAMTGGAIVGTFMGAGGAAIGAVKDALSPNIEAEIRAKAEQEHAPQEPEKPATFPNQGIEDTVKPTKDVVDTEEATDETQQTPKEKLTTRMQELQEDAQDPEIIKSPEKLEAVADEMEKVDAQIESLSNLEEKSQKELKTIANKLGIETKKGATKTQLIDALEGKDETLAYYQTKARQEGLEVVKTKEGYTIRDVEGREDTKRPTVVVKSLEEVGNILIKGEFPIQETTPIQETPKEAESALDQGIAALKEMGAIKDEDQIEFISGVKTLLDESKALAAEQDWTEDQRNSWVQSQLRAHGLSTKVDPATVRVKGENTLDQDLDQAVIKISTDRATIDTEVEEVAETNLKRQFGDIETSQEMSTLRDRIVAETKDENGVSPYDNSKSNLEWWSNLAVEYAFSGHGDRKGTVSLRKAVEKHLRENNKNYKKMRKFFEYIRAYYNELKKRVTMLDKYIKKGAIPERAQEILKTTLTYNGKPADGNTMVGDILITGHHTFVPNQTYSLEWIPGLHKQPKEFKTLIHRLGKGAQAIATLTGKTVPAFKGNKQNERLTAWFVKQVKSKAFQKVLDQKYPIEKLLKERGLTFENDKDMKDHDLYKLIRACRSPKILGDNSKTGMGVGFDLITCRPSTNCAKCYAASMGGPGAKAVLIKQVANTVKIINDPIAFGNTIAKEAMKEKIESLPFLRLLDAGDMNDSILPYMVKAFNHTAQQLDRPIHIFSRHANALKKLKDGPNSQFLKMISLDPQLMKHTSVKQLVMDWEKYNMAPAWMLDRMGLTIEEQARYDVLKDRLDKTGKLPPSYKKRLDALSKKMKLDDTTDLERLHKAGVLKLILPTSAALYNKLPAHLKQYVCPCDAHERSHAFSCPQCMLGEGGCFMAFAELGVDENGKIWNITDPKLPKNVKGLMPFAGMFGGIFKGLGYAEQTKNVLKESIKAIKNDKSMFNRGKKKSITLLDLRFPGDQVKTSDMDIVDAYINMLERVIKQADKISLYLPGETIQPEVAYSKGKQVTDPAEIARIKKAARKHHFTSYQLRDMSEAEQAIKDEYDVVPVDMLMDGADGFLHSDGTFTPLPGHDHAVSAADAGVDLNEYIRSGGLRINTDPTDAELGIEFGKPLTTDQAITIKEILAELPKISHIVVDGRPVNASYKYKQFDKIDRHTVGKIVKYVEGQTDYQLDVFGEYFTEAERKAAAKTSRVKGAIGSKAVVPQEIIESFSVKGFPDAKGKSRTRRILNYGAGKAVTVGGIADAYVPHSLRLRSFGFKVTDYDFPENSTEGVHNPNALEDEYDIVMASNVLNVQSSLEMMEKTLAQMWSSVAPGGDLVANYPKTPRKSDVGYSGLLSLIKDLPRVNRASVHLAAGNIIRAEKKKAAEDAATDYQLEDTKVVDKYGNPLAVRHVTDQLFTEFDDSILNKASTEVDPLGFFFSENPVPFADNEVEAYLDIQKPYTMSGRQHLDGKHPTRQRLVEKGYDGAIIKPDTEIAKNTDSFYRETQYVAFSSDQIKRIGGAPKPSYQLEHTPEPNWYFSKLEKVITEKVQGTIPADQLRALLKKNGVKDAEIAWYGIDDLQGKVEKKELDFLLAENQIVIEDAIKSQNEPVSRKLKWKKALRGRGRGRMVSPGYTIWRGLDSADHDVAEIAKASNGKYYINWLTSRVPDAEPGTPEDFATLREAKELVQQETYRYYTAYPNADMDVVDSTKFTQYTMPNDVGNIELMLRLKPVPGAGKEYKPPTYHQYDDKVADSNRLLHIRMNKRTDSEGNKVLFIEEIQSDWAQGARDATMVNKKTFNYAGQKYKTIKRNQHKPFGKKVKEEIQKRFEEVFPIISKDIKKLFPDDKPTDEFKVMVYDFYKAMHSVKKSNNWSWYETRKDITLKGDPVPFMEWMSKRTDGKFDDMLKKQRMHDVWFIQREDGIIESNGHKTEGGARKAWLKEHAPNIEHYQYPHHPWADANKWSPLAMKRIIRWAVEHGYDKVVWTDADIQNRRWSLTQVVDRLQWERAGEGKDARYKLTGYMNESNVVNRNNLNESVLRETIGEHADTIINSPTDHGELDRESLMEVKGIGMQSYYNKILPNSTDKFIKKLDSKVKPSRIDMNAANRVMIGVNDLHQRFVPESMEAIPYTPGNDVSAQDQASARLAWRTAFPDRPMSEMTASDQKRLESQYAEHSAQEKLEKWWQSLTPGKREIYEMNQVIYGLDRRRQQIIGELNGFRNDTDAEMWWARLSSDEKWAAYQDIAHLGGRQFLGFEITDKMARAAMAGLPTFQFQVDPVAETAGETKAINDVQASNPGITITKRKRDLGFFQKWILTLGNQSKKSGSRNVQDAADTMINTSMMMKDDIESTLTRDRKIYKTLPKEWKANNGKKLFELMDKYLTPEMIDRDPDIPDAVKPVIKHFKQMDEAVRQRVITEKREMARAMYNGKTKPLLRADLQEAGLFDAEHAALWERPRQFVNEFGQTPREWAAETLTQHHVPDSWGRKWSHIQHIFFGQYKLQYKGEDGSWRTIGSAETQRDALQQLKAARANNRYPSATEYRATVDQNIPLDVLRLSRGQYQAIVSNLKNSLDSSAAEVNQAMRGTIGKKASRRKWWGALQQRKGALGFSQDFWKVWEATTAQYYRWSYLSDMNREIEPMIQAVRGENMRKWADHLEYIRDFMWGRNRSDLSDWLDERLSKAPGIGKIVKPFFLERWGGKIKSFNYWRHLQTGRFYVINSMQLFQTLLPVIGEGGLVDAVKLFYSAEGKEILKRHHIGGMSNRFHETGLTHHKWEKFTPAGWSEGRNQGVAFLALYTEGRRQGLNDKEAAKYGRLRGQVMSQFAYAMADVPRIMQNPVGSVLFQYKRFGIKNLELVARLAREGEGLDRLKGPGRWLAAMAALGGIKSLMIGGVTQGLYSVLGGQGFLLYALYKWIEDEFGKEAADVVHHGLPGLLGTDFSGSVNPVDVPWGKTPQEKIGNMLMGPTGQTAWRLYSDINEEMDYSDKQLGMGKQAVKSIIDQSPTIKQFYWLAKAIEKDTSDLDTKGRKRYNLEVADAWKKAFGIRPETETLQRLTIEAARDLSDEYNKTLNKIVDYEMAGEREDAVVEMRRWNMLWPETPISVRDARRRIQSRGKLRDMSASERAIKGLPRKLKKTIEELN